ncbi:MAG: T9SS type A sorting domain-containing protein, partial [Bacteroidia bacterium]
VSSQITKNHTHALFYQPGTQAGELPKILYNTIKIPLSDFTGIDLTQVQAIKFLFNKTGAGAIMISDLCLTGHPPITTSVANNLESTVLIYPNPADNNVNIDLGNSYKENTKLNLYDIQGKLVCHFENVKDELIKIDLTNFENGIYILNIVSDKVAKNYKIVKQ